MLKSIETEINCDFPGGGVQLFPGRGGGGGVQMLNSIETNITCDFPGGGGVWIPYPPLDPCMT